MKPTIKYLISIFTLAILELTGFLLLGTQDNIVETIFCNGNNVAILFTEIPFLALYLYTICFLFAMCFTKYDDRLLSQAFGIFKKSLIFFFITKITVDLIALSISKFTDYGIYMNYWLPKCLLLIITVMFLLKKNNVVKRKLSKAVIVCCTIAGILIIATIILYILKISYFQNAMDNYKKKYGSFNTTETFTIIKSRIEIINLYTVIILYALEWLLFISIYKTSYVPNKNTSVPTYFFRLFIASVCYLIYFVLFFIFAPYGPCVGFEKLSRGFGYVNGEKHFRIGDSDDYYYRKKTMDGNKYIAYNYQTITIKYNNEHLLDYKPLFPVDLTKELTNIEGTSCYQYDNILIAYIDDAGNAKAIPVEEIKNQSKSEELTNALEQLISEGNFDFFEYGYEYMLKYDKSFILPYIEDYADDGELKDKRAYYDISRFYRIDVANKIKVQ